MRDLSPAVNSGLMVFLTIFGVEGLHTPSLWAGPPPAAAVAVANSPIDVSIRPGAESYVLLHVEPYAACLVTEPRQKTPEAGRPLFSEDNGVLLFAVSTRSTAGSEQMIVLDCSDEKGVASRHLVKLSVGERQQPTPSTRWKRPHPRGFQPTTIGRCALRSRATLFSRHSTT